ncbi:MAG: DegT/DnrJ/EryC1/StrS family aminotransferase [Deltaproteobacteria bacterium]|nr:DegT/DnrJ/EryC1/StrS family aminotransferase [Deltaproteobacteria bacterium]
MIFKRSLIPSSIPEVDFSIFFETLRRCFSLESTKVSLVDSFESEYAHFIGVKYAIAFSSARAALYHLYSYFNCQGKYVIAPAYTCIPAINAIQWAGALPYFVDIDLHTYNPILYESIFEKKNVGAICLSYLYGLIKDPSKEIELARKYQIPLIEDAAIACGGMILNKRVGGGADAGVFSLQSSKIMSSWRGGIVTTNRKDLYDYLKAAQKKMEYSSVSKFLVNMFVSYLRALCANHAIYGWTFAPLKKVLYSKYLHPLLWKLIDQNPSEALTGANVSIMPIADQKRWLPHQSVTAHQSLKKIQNILDQRRSIAAMYHENLKDIKRIQLPREGAGVSNVYGRFPIRIDGVGKREAYNFFLKNGVEVSLNYPYLCVPSGIKARFPNACIASQETFLLPMHTRLTNDEINHIIDVTRKIALNGF